MNRQQRREYGRQNGVPMPPPEQQSGMGFQYAPVPTLTTVGTAETSDGNLVFLGVNTPTGPQGFFLSPEHAKTVAAQLAQAALSADTGLQIIGAPGAVEVDDVDTSLEAP